jgi:fused signal recognition particle receptor
MIPSCQIDFGLGRKYNDHAMIKKLQEKLTKTRTALRAQFEELLSTGKNREGILEELLEILILNDVGYTTAENIIAAIRLRSMKTDGFTAIKNHLETELINLLSSYDSPSENSPPEVIMVVGVNGGGKTTSLAKLAHSFKAQGRESLLVAADTFRAAAPEQLTAWGKKLNLPVIRGQYGADPASVVFDAVQSFKARESQVLLIDTAGRIHTNVNLMNELEKIKRVISREMPESPEEVLLVLDATIGQNALIQAREFLKFSGITGILISKLDGTAKGGSVIAIADELKLPVKYIGVGELEGDLLPFSAEEFVRALLT